MLLVANWLTRIRLETWFSKINLFFLVRAPNRYTKLLKKIPVCSIRNVIFPKNKLIETALNKKPIASNRPVNYQLFMY
jgi:hypothetical protein|tara:strand:+ start:21 stop:254 length:234 start_codon:yes stop_codon:yes gene_type:complete